MVVSDHTAKAFDVDLQELARIVVEMGGLTEKQLTQSLDALARRDPQQAQQIVAADLSVDALQRDIEQKAVLTIARRQPMAVDLREILAALRLCNDLDRPCARVDGVFDKLFDRARRALDDLAGGDPVDFDLTELADRHFFTLPNIRE